MQKNPKRSAFSAFCLLLSAFCFLPSAFAVPDKEPVEVRADQVEYFDGLRKVVAIGNVEAVYHETKLTCDRATIYMDTKDAYLEGKVRLVQMGGLLRGEEMVYNFETRKGTVLAAEGEAGPWRTRGDRADKIAADTYVHHRGYLTSCDFEEPHTRLQAREVRVFMDDKVVLKHAVMYIGSVPVFYVPSYTHILDDKRPRVAIVPGRSKEWGAFLLTSWKIYWNEDLQGQYHQDYREQLGFLSGFDIKYRSPIGGEGLFRSYYTDEKDIHTKHAWTKLVNDKFRAPNTERQRYRFQLRHIWDIDEFTKATLEYNRESDATMIQDFFLREHEQGGTTPPTYFQFLKTSPWYGLTFLVNTRANRFETTTQLLPSVTLNLRPIGLPWLPNLAEWVNLLDRRGTPMPNRGLPNWFYLSSFKYEHSNVADAKLGTEASLLAFDSTHEIFHPMRLLRRFNARPFFRFRQSTYSRGLIQTDPQFRQAAAVGFNLNSLVYRVFPLETNLWGLHIDRLRHLVTPSLTYLYQAQPTINADKLIRPDGLVKSNILTPSIEHKFQTKRSGGLGAQTADLIRFITTMPYDLEGPNGRGGFWQPLSMTLEATPYSWMRLQSDAQIDSHIGKFTTINADFVVHPGSQSGWSGRSIGEVTSATTGTITELPWAAGVGWRYQRKTSAQLTMETQFDLTPKWRLGIYQLFDVKRFTTEPGTNFAPRTVKKIYDLPEFEYRLRRDFHEWTVELVHNVRRGHGQTTLLVFRLKAAPELPFDLSRSYHQPKAGRNFLKPGESPPVPAAPTVSPTQ